MALEECLQVFLSATRLRKNQRLASCACRSHLLETYLQSLKQRVRLSVDPDAARPGGKLAQYADLLSQLLSVDRDGRCLRRNRICVFGEDFVKQIVFNLLGFDQRFGKFGIAQCLLITEVFEALPEACRALRR